MVDKKAEPEVVAWAMKRSDGRVMDVICPDEHESCEGSYTVPLITLQAHREAIAKKDEALKFYTDNLFRRKSNGEPCIQTAIEHDCGDRARAAITQSQGSLNDMG